MLSSWLLRFIVRSGLVRFYAEVRMLVELSVKLAGALIMSW
uniref:Uncharacterized protein n=1 Tax=Solanum lycopersicum TaxID=4081 RepID=A0A3Q7EWL2_SOLLC